MSNNKQTEIDIAELAMKLYPFSNSERNAFITGYNKAKESEIHWKTTLLMMTNNKQKTAVEWYIIQRDELEIKSRYLEIKPDQYGKQLIALGNKAREMYQDEIEAAIIKDCAERSTFEASSYSEGYKQGYNRAIELTKWAISNLIPPSDGVQ